MRTITKNVYTISEHPNKEACFNYIRNNWHDLGEHYVEEMVDSLKSLASAVSGTLDYNLSIAPDRAEHCTITDYDAEALAELYDKREDCPLTGVCYDQDVIEGLHNGDLGSVVLKHLHAEGEYIYSDEGLEEMCEANDYEFYEDGTPCL